MSDWQPIETAPRDGTRVLTHRLGYAESDAVAWWNSSQDKWVPVHGSGWHSVTHWQPLPEPPEVSNQMPDEPVLCRDAGGLDSCPNQASEKAHTCPFREEIHNDRESTCRCCADCEYECSQDV